MKRFCMRGQLCWRMSRVPYYFIQSAAHVFACGPRVCWPRLYRRGARGDLRATAVGGARARCRGGASCCATISRARAWNSSRHPVRAPRGPGDALTSAMPRRHCARDRGVPARTRALMLSANSPFIAPDGRAGQTAPRAAVSRGGAAFLRLAYWATRTALELRLNYT